MLDDPTGLADEDGKTLQVSEAMRIAIKLLAILGQRRTEARARFRSWLIDAKRMKGSKAHVIPLPETAIPLIDGHGDAGPVGKYV